MKKDLIVRQITEADYSTVYDLIQTAFEMAEHRDGDEQDFAVGLRNGENYICTVSITPAFLPNMSWQRKSDQVL